MARQRSLSLPLYHPLLVHFFIRCPTSPMLRLVQRHFVQRRGASLLATNASYSSTCLLADVARQGHSCSAAFQRGRRAQNDGTLQPLRQSHTPRRSPRRTSLLEQLRDFGNPEDSADADDVSKTGPSPHTVTTTLAVPTSHTAPATGGAPSAYVSASTLLSAKQQAEANAANAPTHHHHHRFHAAHAAAAPAAASFELVAQQRALRDAFTHAREHHNVKLRKDPRLYRAECKAFRQAHNGRSPTTHEVSPSVAVPLAPVGVLSTLAHADRKRSLLRGAAEDAVLLHNAVAKNELVKSNSLQLVRCLRCFHVYTARPRTLWGGEVEQSGIEYERAQSRAAAGAQLMRKPWLRKRVGSVGRQQRAQEADPTCCPQCRSTRAQWMMEYVHHHTHEKS